MCWENDSFFHIESIILFCVLAFDLQIHLNDRHESTDWGLIPSKDIAFILFNQNQLNTLSATYFWQWRYFQRYLDIKDVFWTFYLKSYLFPDFFFLRSFTALSTHFFFTSVPWAVNKKVRLVLIEMLIVGISLLSK